jgi:hypothetical protein
MYIRAQVFQVALMDRGEVFLPVHLFANRMARPQVHSWVSLPHRYYCEFGCLDSGKSSSPFVVSLSGDFLSTSSRMGLHRLITHLALLDRQLRAIGE